MIETVIISASLTAVGAVIKIAGEWLEHRRSGTVEKRTAAVEPATVRDLPAAPQATPAGLKILIVFSLIVLAYGIWAVIYYWNAIRSRQESLLFISGLFLAMIAGMFVQVLASNYRSGRELFEVSASQLIFPTLFSLIVFYPIWALTASAEKSFFAFHAAFLNGYFWESVVSSAHPVGPKPGEVVREAGGDKSP